MNGHPWGEHAELYVLDALSPEETAFFEKHLAECPDCRAAVDELRETAALMAHAVPTVAPPPGLRDRILADARRSRAEGPVAVPETRTAPPAPVREAAPARRAAEPVRRAGGGWAPWLAAAASLALALAAGAGLLREREQRAAADEELRRTLATLEERDSLLAQVLGPEVRTATLAATGEAPSMRLFWDAARGTLILSARNLPPPGAGRTYQLWGIAGEAAPVSLGTFETEADGTVVVALQAPPGARFDISAVTDEPAGGSPQPTTTPFLVGSWQGAE